MMSALPLYPFSALHGQPLLQRALLLAAVDARIGGVLIVGPRGAAKSTSARALAELLPGAADDQDSQRAQFAQFVNLPLGSSEEQLVGSLDLESVLQDSRVRFRPGLLARAHGGVLYIDEVNLLADSLVDLLLDVSASGVNRIERDGISHQHPALITLIGTMNPEEGELRPQLLDRFGLYVSLDDSLSAADREAIVRARLAFDEAPQAFLARHAPAQQALKDRLASARQQLATIAFDDTSHAAVARRCAAAGVEGVRADLVMLRAARAHAALAGRQTISTADIDAVAELVLAHRRRHDSPPPADNTDSSDNRPDTAADDSPQQASNTAPENDPRDPAGQQPPANAATPDSDQQHTEQEGEDGDWGALAAPAVAISTRKPLRPLMPKKP